MRFRLPFGLLSLLWASVFPGFLNAQDPTIIDSFPNGLVGKKINFYYFENDPAPLSSTAELDAAVPLSYHSHPEYGINPYDGDIDSTYELIDQRTVDTRTFVKQGTNGSVIYKQTGYFAMHYLDAQGWWRTIDDRLHPTNGGEFTAMNQPEPTKINVDSGYATIVSGSYQFRFNRNLKLYYEDVNGNRSLIANADWTTYTAGSQGVKVTDIFPGIDMEVMVGRGRIKTNYVVSAPMNYTSGWLVIADDMNAGVLQVVQDNGYVDGDGLYHGSLKVIDGSNNSHYSVGEAVGFDQTNLRTTNSFGYRLNGNQLEMYIPATWLSDANLSFPLVIDPLVQTSGTMLQGAIAGSGLNNSGSFVGSCNYNMAVATPANCTITNIFWMFNYIAQNGAVLCEGGLDFQYGACRSPAAAGFYWFCNNCVFAGTCNSGPAPGISMWSDFSPCVPAPQCAPYNMNFTMRFYDRWAGAACSNVWIAAGSNWLMTIQGQTVAEPAAPTSSNGTTICLGTYTTLTANGQYGVPGYTYLWNPGGQTTQSITVYPTVTTTYTCTITDACGITATNQVTITVNTVNTLTPTPVFSVSLNPPSGSPCPVTATVTYTGANNYGGGAETYQWSFGGSSNIAGGSTSGSASAPPYGGPYTVTYNTPGSYALSVTIFKSGQCATSTQTITICGALPVELVNFDAEYTDDHLVHLNWTTASETNCSHFIIERSTDGINFEYLSRVNSLAPGGTSSQTHYYELYDAAPFTDGFSYYRLTQVDLNGTESNAVITSIEIHDVISSLQVVPNPADDYIGLAFTASNNGSAQVEIMDYTGRVIQTLPVSVTEGSNRVDLDLATYTEGLYFVRIIMDDKAFQSTFILQ